MEDERQNVALTIKTCLESLQEDAVRGKLMDLARFIELAAMAAEEAAESWDGKSDRLKAYLSSSVGHC